MKQRPELFQAGLTDLKSSESDSEEISINGARWDIQSDASLIFFSCNFEIKGKI